MTGPGGRVNLQVLMHDIKTVDAEAVVVGFHADVRPLKGVAGELDWVLCGSLSRLLLEGRIQGDLGDVALLTTDGKIPAHKVFMVGLGQRDGQTCETLRTAARIAAACLSGAGIGSAVLDLFPLGPTMTDDDAVAAVRQGIAQGAAGKNLEVSLLAQDQASFEMMSRAMRV